MSVEDRFFAAVNVISGLPKHGPYQPSKEMKLSFYAYYKQATEGPNTDPKPWTLEVVKKAKWDAWRRLGDMSKEEAMTKYVDELNKIVETMSYTENVADFLESMDDFNSQAPDKNVTLAIEPAVKKISSLPGSPVPSSPPASKDTSPVKTPSETKECSAVEDDDDEFYTDSNETSIVHDNSPFTVTKVLANGHLKHGQNLGHEESTTDILMRTVLTMRTELNEITASVRKMEQKHKLISRRAGLFRGLSNQTVAFIILWPVVANLLLIYLSSGRRIRSRH